MSRVRRRLGFAAIGTVAGLASLAPAALAETIVVQPDERIQRAINQADRGDRVVVRPGTYRESLQIRTDELTLQGRARGAVLKQPRNPRSSRCNERGFTVGICIPGRVDFSDGTVRDRVVGVTIKGFKVRGFSGDGLLAAGTRDLFVGQTKFLENEGYGAFSLLSKRTRFRNDRAAANGEAGFYVGDSPRSGTQIRLNNSIGNRAEGIFLRSASRGTVARNILRRNCAGILVLADAPGPARRWTISRNEAVRNNAACEGEEGPPFSGLGIALIGAERTVAKRNDTHNNRPTGPTFASGGIVISSGPNGTTPKGDVLRSNKAFHNAPADISWDESGSVTFKDNHCDTSDPSGLCR